MQMLFEGSEESPGVPGLGVLPGSCRLLPDDVKRPQMQWNLLERRGDPELLSLAPDPAWAYFVHSYARSEEHTSELQSLMRISYAVFCLKKKNKNTTHVKD